MPGSIESRRNSSGSLRTTSARAPQQSCQRPVAAAASNERACRTERSSSERGFRRLASLSDPACRSHRRRLPRNGFPVFLRGLRPGPARDPVRPGNPCLAPPRTGLARNDDSPGESNGRDPDESDDEDGSPRSPARVSRLHRGLRPGRGRWAPRDPGGRDHLLEQHRRRHRCRWRHADRPQRPSVDPGRRADVGRGDPRGPEHRLHPQPAPGRRR